METLRRILRGIDTFTQWQGYFLSFLCIFLVFITLYDITARQFGLVTMWSFDVEWFIYAFILMVGMGYTALKKQHVRIDLLTTRFSPWTQELIMASSYAIFVIPLTVFIAVSGWYFAMRAFERKEITLLAWYAPLWPIKFFIFLGCIMMLPQCFAELTRHIYFLVKRERL